MTRVRVYPSSVGDLAAFVAAAKAQALTVSLSMTTLQWPGPCHWRWPASDKPASIVPRHFKPFGSSPASRFVGP
jgi:hypothetical protein